MIFIRDHPWNPWFVLGGNLRMHFSARVPGNLDDNALARAVAARRAERKVIYDLTLSNPTQAGFVYPQKEIAAALAAGTKAAYAPEPRGLLGARKVIAAQYRGRGPDAVRPRKPSPHGQHERGVWIFVQVAGRAGCGGACAHAVVSAHRAPSGVGGMEDEALSAHLGG